MKTLLASEVTDADRPFLASRGHADGTVTLYYEGDTIPPIPVGTTGVTVDARQFRQALTKANLRASAEALVAASSQDVKDWYEYAPEFTSNHPVLIAMAAQMGKTQADIDALFALAMTL